jgi:DNA (cytosine-5)-methyltransferase 1
MLLLPPIATNAPTAGSLFSGIGGIDLAFTWAGFDVRWQVEIDPFCRKVLQKHSAAYWRNAKVYEDVRNVGKQNLCTVDALVGGFPCQDTSKAGSRQGIREDTRSGLWFEFARVIGEIRPRVVLVENVPGLLTLDGVRVVADLTRMGYRVEWGVMGSLDIGADHARERVWCVGYADSDRLPVPEVGQPDDHQERHSEARQQEGYSIGNSPVSAGVVLGRDNTPHESIMGRALNGLSAGMDRVVKVARQGQPQLAGEPPRQLAEKPAHWKERLAALGNAVDPRVAYPVALAIRNHIR